MRRWFEPGRFITTSRPLIEKHLANANRFARSGCCLQEEPVMDQRGLGQCFVGLLLLIVTVSRETSGKEKRKGESLFA